VSGGHCQLLTVRGPGDFTRLGTTIDDAAGECFDKTAKLLGLGFPGGPAVERAAEGGDPRRFALPRPMWRKPGCDFSFSGLKTAVAQAVAAYPAGALPVQEAADLAASFQAAVADVMADRARHAMAIFRRTHPATALVVAGGVAANATLRQALTTEANRAGFRFVAPPLRLCTDNAVMVAWAALERLRHGWTDELNHAPRPRWPLDSADMRP
jgi:N6-L-threonylcarbamoyladenine synthase